MANSLILPINNGVKAGRQCLGPEGKTPSTSLLALGGQGLEVQCLRFQAMCYRDCPMRAGKWLLAVLGLALSLACAAAAGLVASLAAAALGLNRLGARGNPEAHAGIDAVALAGAVLDNLGGKRCGGSDSLVGRRGAELRLGGAAGEVKNLLEGTVLVGLGGGAHGKLLRWDHPCSRQR